MKIAKAAVRFLCTIGILLFGVYTVLAAAVAFFIIAGVLTPGEVMFYDSRTPTLFQTILFFAAGSIIVGSLALARHKLSLSIQQ